MQGSQAGRTPPRAPGREQLGRTVAEQIKRHILEHRLRPGDPLPTENELCATLGASRSSVREAMKTLAALDIVQIRHGNGTFVGSLSLAPLVASLTFRGRYSPGDDARVLAELVELRQLFEQGMAARIVAALDDDRLAELDAQVAAMTTATGAELVAADREFHRLLIEPTGNALVGQMTGAFWDVYAVVAPDLATASDAETRQALDAHRSLVAAARTRDPGAFVTAVEAHYAPLRQRLTAAAGPVGRTNR
jgi:DNA-binding FadR family transcriptional regulator